MPAVNKMSSLVEAPDLVEQALRNRGMYSGQPATNRRLHEWAGKFIKAAAEQGVPLRVHGGYRSLGEQNRLFSRGVSKAPAGRSAHNYGMAVDVIHIVKAWEGMTDAQWRLLGLLGFEVARRMDFDLSWGGDNTTFPLWHHKHAKRDKFHWDPAHWEISQWRERAGVEWASCPSWIRAQVFDPRTGEVMRYDG